MPVSAETLRMLIDAGLSGDGLVSVVASIDADMAATAPTVDLAAERKRAADRIRMQEKRHVARLSRDMSRDTTSFPEQKSPTPPKTQTLSPEPPSPPKGGSSPDEITAAFDAYNVEARNAGWPVAEKLNAERRPKLKARLAECGGIIGWIETLARARASPFLAGQNDRGWRPGLDFFLQQSSFIKVREGAYDGNRNRQSTFDKPAARRSGTDALMAALSAEAEQPDVRRLDGARDPRADFANGPIVDLAPLGPDRSMAGRGQH